MRKRIQIGLALFSAVLFSLPTAADSLRNDILFLLPQESGEVGFIDLAALRSSPHYELIKQRLLPRRFANFERFVRSTGVDVDQDVDWLAWVLVPPGPEQPGELFLGVAQGQFVPENVEGFFERQKLPIDSYRGQTLFPFGSGVGSRDLFFAFLDSSTAAFGPRPSLELLLETRFGTNDNLLTNETLFDLLSEVNGRVPVWIVLDDHYTRLAVRQLVPEAAKFDQYSELAEKFRSSLISLDVGRDVDLSFQARMAEPADAQILSLLLQTGLIAQSWQVEKNDPALSSVLRSASVNSAGDRLQVELEVEEESVQALLERRRVR